MKLLYCLSMVTSLLVLCEGRSYWTEWTTASPVGPPVNLKGKMVTVSQGSGVTFYQPYYQPEGPTTTPTPRWPDWTTEWPTRAPRPRPTHWPYRTTEWPTRAPRPRPTHWPYRTTEWTTRAPRPRPTHYPYWTTRYPWTTPSPTAGVSVCLRFMTDSTSFTLFNLGSSSTYRRLTFSFYNSWYSLSGYSSQLSLNPRIPISPSVRSQPWTSVCVVVNSVKNVVQVFQGGAMSIRKIVQSRMVWSGEPILEMSHFDGQVTDLEVWDYPLQYREILGYMLNYGSSGNVLTWSNIAYSYSGRVLVEETYAQRMNQPISSSDGEEPPIRGEQRRDRWLKHKKKLLHERRQKKNKQIF